MKLLASDYDGTLEVNGYVQEEDLLALKKWKKAGNLFAIITGRDILMSQKVIKKYQLPVDFIICNNGAVIYDKEFNELNATYIPIEIIQSLIKHPLIQKSSYVVLADQFGRYVYDEQDKSILKDLYYTEILQDWDIHTKRKFYQMDTRYPSSKEMRSVAQNLQVAYKDTITIHPNIDTMDITPKNTSKYLALKEQVEQLDLKKESVITVGDGLNDLEMIEYYQGYSMNWSIEEIKKKSKGSVSSLSEVIDSELKD